MGLLDNQTSEEYYEGKTGGYRYISLKDIVNNFMVSYVGDGKLIDYINRTDVIFHAKRAIQRFSYDISRVEKIQEVEVTSSLSIPMPQDYVSMAGVSWIDNNGIKHPIYETRLTSKPSESPLQDSNGDYIYDTNGELVTGSSITDERYKSFDTSLLSGRFDLEQGFNNLNDYENFFNAFGARFGLNPETAQVNGSYIVDEANGKISFSSDMVNRIVVLTYVSDGLGTDEETKVHKFLEEAMYMYIVHAVLSSKQGVPEYQIRRFAKAKKAEMNNAKIRLSNYNKQELLQTLRGKSKRIKG